MNVKETIFTLKHIPNSVSVMIKGNHGIGKSQVVKQVASDLGIPCIDFRLSQNDVGDIKGIPFQRNGRTVFAPPDWFPLTEQDAKELKELFNLTDEIKLGRFGNKGILFLDEINRASREVQQAAFELVLDRRLNLRSLPDGWRVVTAINDNDDLYSVGSLDPAFVSRFMVVDFQPTVDEWFDWARAEGLHDSVTTFLVKHPDLLDPSTEMITKNNTNGVSKLHDRRSWHKFSDTLINFEKNGESALDKSKPNALDYLTKLATGFVGSVVAAKFRSYIESDYDALSAKVILTKWDKGVEAKLLGVVKIGRIPELASYNDLIVAFLKEQSKMTDKMKENFTNYIRIMPKEISSSLWQSFNKEIRPMSEDWFSASPENSKLVLDALVKPDSMTKAKPTAKV